MLRKTVAAMAFVFLWAGVTVAQDSSGYLDVFTVKVKPEKRAEFDAMVKKMVEANRSQNGDTWTALEITYGEGDTVSFASMRRNFADIDGGMHKFIGAMNKAYGEEEVGRIFKEFSACVNSTHSELRRRRADLSSNMPANEAEAAKVVGESRWLRTSIVHIRPGRADDFAAQLKIIKEATEKEGTREHVWISQAVAGEKGAVFYITRFANTLGDFDSGIALKKVLGEDGYKKFLQNIEENVLNSENVISRFLPALSNPPDEIASVAPAFWRPSPSAKPTTAP